MSLEDITLISCGGLLIVIIFRAAMKGKEAPFVHSLLKRLFDIAITASITCITILFATYVLEFYYRDGISYEALMHISDFQNKVSSWLEWLPAPFYLAIGALALVIWTSFTSSKHRSGQIGNLSSSLFLHAQPWLNRLSVDAVILATFTYLTSDGTGAKLRLETAIADAESGAAALDQEIDDFAATVVATELYEEIVGTIPDGNWGELGMVAMRFSELQASLNNRQVLAENITTRKVEALLGKQFPKPAKKYEASVHRFDQAVRRFTASILKELADGFRELRLNIPLSTRGGQIRPEIRTAFVDLAAKAVVQPTLKALPKTGSVIVDLLAEAVTETVIEKMRERAQQLSRTIKDAMRIGGNQSVAEFMMAIRNRIERSPRVTFGVGQIPDGGYRIVRVVYDETILLDNALRDELQGICSAPEVSLMCTRVNVPYCGLAATIGTRC